MHRLIIAVFPVLCILTPLPLTAAPTNIVWIVIEDASPHIGCYGETAINTPVAKKISS